MQINFAPVPPCVDIYALRRLRKGCKLRRFLDLKLYKENNPWLSIYSEIFSLGEFVAANHCN